MSYAVKCPECGTKIYNDLPFSKRKCPECGTEIDFTQEGNEGLEFKEWLEETDEIKNPEEVIEITEKIIKGEDLEEEIIKDWHEIMIKYNKDNPKKRLEREIDFRAVNSWVQKNKSFGFYNKLYQNSIKKEGAKESVVSANVFYNMLRDFSVRALIPKIDNVKQSSFTYFNENKNRAENYFEDNDLKKTGDN